MADFSKQMTLPPGFRESEMLVVDVPAGAKNPKTRVFFAGRYKSDVVSLSP